ncbi:MAG: aminomethyl-transferring glycine dehydrogenase subunit GcvPA [Acidobacteria bacterium]|nr:aminomethyl-transferring glycine dehydrogenase subunit GcvPA [Acidobacteriota bacterium]
MRYLSLTAEEKLQMLDAIGIRRVEDLFAVIPPAVRLKEALKIPEAWAESTVLDYFKSLGKRNASSERHGYFLGAGAYNHFIPSVVDAVISRSEFYTAYTPYQPEISQGTLQAIFEYQTLICQLTGMDVANASLYDGASALAEAVLMAQRITGRSRALVPPSLHPNYRQVLATYLANLDFPLDELRLEPSGRLDLNYLESALDDRHAAVVVQNPNFFGVIEDLKAVSAIAQRHSVLTIATVTEAISLALLQPAGQLGIDIVAGEGQSFGIPFNYGGPYLGLFATRNQYLRQIPGRLVGQTVDTRGRRSFVLTLSTREQHIKRERATSNICTNQGLCALTASVYLCALGKSGLRQLAEHNVKKAHYLKNLLKDYVVFSGPIFNEMVLTCDEHPRKINRRLFGEGIVGGLPLGKYYPERSHQMLICVTEQNSRAQIKRFAELFKAVEVAK